MMKRFTTAIRLLLGRPIACLSIDDTMLLVRPEESDCDYAKQPPFDLAFPGHVANSPPVKIFREDRLRVCMFSEIDGERCCECGRAFHWFVLELRGNAGWYHLLTLHESKLAKLMSLFKDVMKYLEEQ